MGEMGPRQGAHWERKAKAGVEACGKLWEQAEARVPCTPPESLRTSAAGRVWVLMLLGKGRGLWSPEYLQKAAQRLCGLEQAPSATVGTDL